MKIEQARNKLRAGLLSVLRGVAFDVHAKIVQRTPIDTGRAKASWRLSENQADDSVEPPYANRINPVSGDIIQLAGPGESPLFANQADSVARAQQQKIGPDAKTIVVSNNLDYIEKLENGTSQQAPAGMVAVTLTPDAVEWMVESALKKAFANV